MKKKYSTPKTEVFFTNTQTMLCGSGLKKAGKEVVNHVGRHLLRDAIKNL